MVETIWPIETHNWEGYITELNNRTTLKPFSDQTFKFLRSLSKLLLNDHSNRENPELIALGYWLRKTNLFQMRTDFEQESANKILKARGTVLHFAPSNVDTIFAYSWVLSLLAGNRNIIRISSKKRDVSNKLLNAIIYCLNQPENHEIACRTMIVSYEHKDTVTTFLSEQCHVRVIWGGDISVRTIRQIPLPPLAIELVFPDRFSIAILKASSVEKLNQEEHLKLVKNFFNDSFWFGQMACSSPRLLVWEGNQEEVHLAQSRFWEELRMYVNQNFQDYSSAIQVQRLANEYLLAIQPTVKAVSHQTEFSRATITDLYIDMRQKHNGGGLFLEWVVEDIRDIAPSLADKDQTISYFGFTKEELFRFLDSIENRSIDRIVPIGHALDFNGVWDGYRLINYFTREILIL